jgi:hypothetical protein
MAPASAGVVLGLCLAGWGVAHCGGGAFITTAPELPSAARRPDGVLLDPPPAVPSAEDHAPARGVVALRQPVADEELVKLVRDFLQGFEHEDIEALRELVTNDVTQLDAHGRGSSQGLLDVWRMRMRSLDYTKLAGTEVFHPQRLERFTYDELGESGQRLRPAEMRPGDVLLRVPIQTPRIGGYRLFGDVVVLLLRRDDGRFRIAGYNEEDVR